MKKFYSSIFVLICCLFTSNVSFAQTESEPNGTFSDANTIVFGSTIKGSISPTGDKDYFKFEVIEPGIIEIQVTGVPNNIDMQVELHNPLQSKLGTRVAGQGQPVFLERLVCELGTYFVVLSDQFSNATNADQYQLTVSFDNSDPFECNNSFSDATAINFDQNIKASIRNVGDKDYFKFEVIEPGIIEMQVTGVPNNIDMQVELYNPLQSKLGTRVAGQGQSAFLERLVCEPGTYFVVLSDQFSNAANADQYQLIISFTSLLILDSSEENESFTDATSITFCDTLSATISTVCRNTQTDQDFYKLELKAGETIPVSVNSVPNELRMFMKFFDPNMQPIDSVSGGSGISINSTLSATTDGFHFIRITDSRQNESLEQYDIIIGCKGMTDAASIDFSEKINISPNPFLDILTIKFNDLSGEKEISIFDLHGKELFTEISIENELQINHPLPNGVLFLSVKNNDQTATLKILKQ